MDHTVSPVAAEPDRLSRASQVAEAQLQLPGDGQGMKVPPARHAGKALDDQVEEHRLPAIVGTADARAGLRVIQLMAVGLAVADQEAPRLLPKLHRLCNAKVPNKSSDDKIVHLQPGRS